jgi:heptose-I-phosphate ethanolaminephosphotransferase
MLNRHPRLRRGLRAILPVLPVLAFVALTPIDQREDSSGFAFRLMLFQNIFVAAGWLAVIVIFARMGLFWKAIYHYLLFGALVYIDWRSFGPLAVTHAIFYQQAVLMLLCAESLLGALMRRRLPALRLPVTILWYASLGAGPVAAIIYMQSENVALEAAAIVAILQTNVREAVEYGWVHLSSFSSAMAAGLLAAACFLPYRQHRSQEPSPQLPILALLFLLSASSLWRYQEDARALSMVTGAVITYREEVRELRKQKKKRMRKLPETSAAKEASGETFILVIGESHNRHHMSLYAYPRKTTPWIDAAVGDDGWVVLSRAFANHVHTVQVIQLALTSANQYNRKDYVRSPSTIEIARQAGFRTYWLSNQVRLGSWDTPVTVIADASDHYRTLNRHIGESDLTNVHDEALIPLLDQALSSGAGDETNRFIVVHLAGNHHWYCSRVPADFLQFRNLDPFEIGSVRNRRGSLSCYDESVRYVDHVLGRLFEVAKAHAATAFVYLADHSDAVLEGVGHNAADYRDEMSHIPMFAWLAPEYRQRYPEASRRLMENRDRIFTNDLLHDTLIGILGIDTPFYDARFDLSSSEYVLTDDKALTLHGARRLSADPWLIRQRNIEAIHASAWKPKVMAHRVNTLGGLQEMLASGMKLVEVDVLIRNDAPRQFIEVGHDEESMTGGNLEAYLERAEALGGLERIWLDVKNLDETNRDFALEEFGRLDRRFGLKNRAILETGNTSDWVADFSREGWHASYYLPTDEILGALEAGDAARLESIAGRIAAQVRNQKMPAVSFDARLFPFVADHLERRLDPAVVFHTWDLDLHLGRRDLSAELERRNWSGNDRVRTIIVRASSRYRW